MDPVTTTTLATNNSQGLSVNAISEVLGIISGIIANPEVSVIALAIVTVILGGVYWYFKAKINAWFVQIATSVSNQQEQNVVDRETLQNQANQDIDNQNAKDIKNY